jgi:hypothetical protein
LCGIKALQNGGMQVELIAQNDDQMANRGRED